MRDEGNNRESIQVELGDIEELMEESRRDVNPSPQERWNAQVELAQAVLWALPGSRVSCGRTRGRQLPTDYITLSPNAPLTVFGPDGRFIVSFLEDDRWIDADGRVTSASAVIEGSPQALARLLIQTAGLEAHRAGHVPRRPVRESFSDGMRRLLVPVPTGTWRDNVNLPAGQVWNEHTPPSLCRESASSRLIVAPYVHDSCTFARTAHPRWGVESLRIPDFALDRQSRAGMIPLEPIRVGDCLLTVGEKLDGSDDPLQYENEVDGVRMWFPQRVLRVEAEGADHLRVWLAWDADVSNDNAPADSFGALGSPVLDRPVVLSGEEALSIWSFLHLNVFCPECGNRAKPIVYGLPGPSEPSYLALGGCIVEPNQPDYVCYCGHEWPDVEETWQ